MSSNDKLLKKICYIASYIHNTAPLMNYLQYPLYRMLNIISTMLFSGGITDEYTHVNLTTRRYNIDGVYGAAYLKELERYITVDQVDEVEQEVKNMHNYLNNFIGIVTDDIIPYIFDEYVAAMKNVMIANGFFTYEELKGITFRPYIINKDNFILNNMISFQYLYKYNKGANNEDDAYNQLFYGISKLFALRNILRRTHPNYNEIINRSNISVGKIILSINPSLIFNKMVIEVTDNGNHFESYCIINGTQNKKSINVALSLEGDIEYLSPCYSIPLDIHSILTRALLLRRYTDVFKEHYFYNLLNNLLTTIVTKLNQSSNIGVAGKHQKLVSAKLTKSDMSEEYEMFIKYHKRITKVNNNVKLSLTFSSQNGAYNTIIRVYPIYYGVTITLNSYANLVSILSAIFNQYDMKIIKNLVKRYLANLSYEEIAYIYKNHLDNDIALIDNKNQVKDTWVSPNYITSHQYKVNKISTYTKNGYYTNVSLNSTVDSNYIIGMSTFRKKIHRVIYSSMISCIGDILAQIKNDKLLNEKLEKMEEIKNVDKMKGLSFQNMINMMEYYEEELQFDPKEWMLLNGKKNAPVD